MNRMYRVGVAALALAAVVSETTAASAGGYICPPEVVAAPASTGATTVLAIFGLGTLLCTAMTWGKMEVKAKGRELTAGERLHAVAGCAFAPIGFAKLMHDK